MLAVERESRKEASHLFAITAGNDRILGTGVETLEGTGAGFVGAGMDDNREGDPRDSQRVCYLAMAPFVPTLVYLTVFTESITSKSHDRLSKYKGVWFFTSKASNGPK